AELRGPRRDDASSPPGRTNPPAGHERAVADEPAPLKHQRLAGRGGRCGGRPIDRGRVARVAWDRAASQGGDRPPSQPLGALSPQEADGADELVRLLVVAIAEELAPAADRPVLGSGWVAAGNDGSCALPEDAVRRGPADPLAVDLAVRQRQAAAVNVDVVVE